MAATRRGIEKIQRLFAEVDGSVERLTRYHGDRLACRRGCTGCCLDGLAIFEVEAGPIRENCRDELARAPHPPGACAFLDTEGACRIYAHRPYVCRTQGLPLRWFSEGDDGQFAELRDICELNEAGNPIESLGADSCWLLGPVEEQLAELQVSEGGGGSGGRVYLRALFRCEEEE